MFSLAVREAISGYMRPISTSARRSTATRPVAHGYRPPRSGTRPVPRRAAPASAPPARRTAFCTSCQHVAPPHRCADIRTRGRQTRFQRVPPPCKRSSVPLVRNCTMFIHVHIPRADRLCARRSSGAAQPTGHRRQKTRVRRGPLLLWAGITTTVTIARPRAPAGHNPAAPWPARDAQAGVRRACSS